MKLTSIPLMLLLLLSRADAQSVVNYNLFDSLGRKNGFWIDGTITKPTWQGYYMHGKMDGLYKQYYTNGALMMIGYYKEDTLTGKSMGFDDQGRLIFTEDSIQLSDITFRSDSNTYFKPHYKSYCTDYYENGRKSREGWLAYDQIFLDFFEIGLWKFYDREGNLVSTKKY